MQLIFRWLCMKCMFAGVIARAYIINLNFADKFYRAVVSDNFCRIACFGCVVPLVYHASSLFSAPSCRLRLCRL